jgi:hypothetical protein
VHARTEEEAKRAGDALREAYRLGEASESEVVLELLR